MYKASRVRFPCTVCSKEAGDGTIQCSTCGDWTHAKCLNVDEAHLQVFIPLDFYCPRCATNNGEFNWEACLKR